jgi:hypothetical protein
MDAKSLLSICSFAASCRVGRFRPTLHLVACHSHDNAIIVEKSYLEILDTLQAQ